MNAWLTARRIKKGQEEEFRKKWKGGNEPDGMLDAYLLEDEEDPRETLSISFWDTAAELLAYRTGEDARKRKGDLDDVVDKERWSRAFVAFNAVDIPSGGGKKKLLLLPLLLIGAGAAAFYFMNKRKASGADEEWENWQPEPVSTFQSGVAPVTATAEDASPRTPPPAIRPLDAEARNGGAGDGRNQPIQATPVTSGRPGSGTESAAPQVTRRAPEAPRHTSPSQTLGSAPMHSPAMPAAMSQGAAQSQGTSAGRPGRTVRDVMTANPETVESSTDVVRAAAMMRDLDVGVLPVVAEGRLAGVITDRDIAVSFAESPLEPARVRVMDVMTDTPRTVKPDTSVEEAARMMAEHQIRRLPVVDGTRLVGIVSLGDVAVDGPAKAAAGALEQISEPASPDR